MNDSEEFSAVSAQRAACVQEHSEMLWGEYF